MAVEVVSLEWEEDTPDWWVSNPEVFGGRSGYEIRITDRGIVRHRMPWALSPIRRAANE